MPMPGNGRARAIWLWDNTRRPLSALIKPSILIRNPAQLLSMVWNFGGVFLLIGLYRNAEIHFLQSIEAPIMFICSVAIDINCIGNSGVALLDREILSIAIMGLLVLSRGLSSCADNTTLTIITDFNKANMGA
jgi:hypothetical protein